MPVPHWQDKYLKHWFGHVVVGPEEGHDWTVDLTVYWPLPLEPSIVQDGIYWWSRRQWLRYAAFWLGEAERVVEAL